MKENREKRQNPSQTPQREPRRDDERKPQGVIGQGREGGQDVAEPRHRGEPDREQQGPPREFPGSGGSGSGTSGAGHPRRPQDGEERRRRQGQQEQYETPPDEEEFSDREGS